VPEVHLNANKFWQNEMCAAWLAKHKRVLDISETTVTLMLHRANIVVEHIGYII
jgi:hypothetical protein